MLIEADLFPEKRPCDGRLLNLSIIETTKGKVTSASRRQRLASKSQETEWEFRLTDRRTETVLHHMTTSEIIGESEVSVPMLPLIRVILAAVHTNTVR